MQNGFIRVKERYLNSLKISDCRAFKPIRVPKETTAGQQGRCKTKDRTGRNIRKLETFLRGPLLNKNVLQNQAKHFRIWVESP